MHVVVFFVFERITWVILWQHDGHRAQVVLEVTVSVGNSGASGLGKGRPGRRDPRFLTFFGKAVYWSRIYSRRPCGMVSNSLSLPRPKVADDESESTIEAQSD